MKTYVSLHTGPVSPKKYAEYPAAEMNWDSVATGTPLWLLGVGDPVWLGEGPAPDPLDYGIHVEGCTCGCPDMLD